MRFEKYQAAGNDFIIIDSVDKDIRLEPGKISRLCDRGFGVGADGLMIARRSGGDLFEMDFNNSDGTKAEMCGNGIRCFVKYLSDKGYLNEGQVEIQTGAGIKSVDFSTKTDSFVATVSIGHAEFEIAKIPASPDAVGHVASYLNEKAVRFVDIALVSVGNPHCIIFVEDLKDIDLGTVGFHIEHMASFPNKINVEFAKIRSRDEIDAIVWERGAGKTLACGTGATAVVAASTKLGFTDERVNVNLPGGTLIITCSQEESLTLTGGAEHVFSGETSSWLGI